MFDPTNDGIDHINVYSKGKTGLGRGLSNWAEWRVTIEPHGSFLTLEGYWFWLQWRDDYLRDCSGYQAKGYNELRERALGKQHIEGFEDWIRRAMRLKIRQCQPLLEGLAGSTLPLAHYYVYGGKAVPAGHDWIVEEWEQIRRELKAGCLNIAHPTSA